MKKQPTTTSKKSVYEIITERILQELAAGVIPWKKPWKSTGMPRNLTTKKAYRGMNVFTLGMAGYGSPFWATFKQVGDLGGSVRKGEKSLPVVFWNWKETEEIDPATGKNKKIPFLRYYSVWNLEQCEGIDPAKIPTLEPMPEGFDPIEAAEGIVEGMPNRPPINFKGDQAAYYPALDVVLMPKKEKFFSAEEYYSTLLHELSHSTGAKNRLNRPGITDFDRWGSERYSKEELVAEFASAMLCGVAGIEQATIQNSAAYIAGWSKKLAEEPKLLICAAAAAQKAVDYILNVQTAQNEETEEEAA